MQSEQIVTEENIIKPTVGRKVWYRPTEYDLQGLGAMTVSQDQPLDATIIAVWSDRCINVLVTDVMGKQYTKTSVKLLQGDDKPLQDAAGKNLGGHVEWMPYQKK